MTNYTKTTNFATKDTLPSGNANKIVKGTEIDTEFNNIATAVATKADTAGPTFTGTVTIPTVDLNGGAIDGTTVGASTAAAITGTTIVANTSINIAGDGATVTGIKDEDDMSSNSATKLATQQSIKAYVDSQITAQDLDFQADSGGALSIDLDSETLTFTGGTGVDTSGSGNAVTFAIDSTVATLTGTQTLTNKTLTSPTLNTPTIGTSFTIGSATITEAELEILDGATVTTAELNVLDGITSTTAELNILDGVTSTTAELNILDGVTATAAELNILDGVTSTAAELNILDGVTSTTAELNILDGVTSTTAELNILDGVTSTTAELNILDGVTATTAELNYVDGVTSAIQTQIDAKAPLASPTFTGTVNAAALTVDTTTLVVDATNNRVGIGASSPSAKLDIAGETRIYPASGTGVLRFGSGGVEKGKLSVDASSNMVFETANSERLRIDSSGNVGIGTSSPAYLIDARTGSGNAQIGLTSGGDLAQLILKSTDTAGNSQINFADADSSNVGMLQYFHSDNHMRFTVNSTEAMRIDSAGSVGIGVTPSSLWSGNDVLQLNTYSSIAGSSSFTGLSSNLAATSSGWAVKYIQNGRGLTYLQDIAGGTHRWYSAASGTAGNVATINEAMRIDSSGNLLVGKTSTANLASDTTAGHTLYSIGIARHVASGSPSLQLTRTSSDGDIAVFTKDGTTVGSIGTSGSNLVIGTGDTGFRFFDGSPKGIFPASTSAGVTDGVIDLGKANGRFDDIYATNGTIQTSDRNEKQDIEALSDAEQRVAVAAKGLLRKFRWISSVEENGDDARIHFGIIAQDLQDAFTAEGLDAGRYAMFISSTWTDEDTGEERSRMGVRYSELLAFIISAI